MTDGDFGRVLGHLYDATMDHRLWPGALDILSGFLEADGACLGADHRHEQKSLSTGASVEILRGYDAYWHSINPLWPSLRAAPAGRCWWIAARWTGLPAAAASSTTISFARGAATAAWRSRFWREGPSLPLSSFIAFTAATSAALAIAKHATLRCSRPISCAPYG